MLCLDSRSVFLALKQTSGSLLAACWDFLLTVSPKATLLALFLHCLQACLLPCWDFLRRKRRESRKRRAGRGESWRRETRKRRESRKRRAGRGERKRGRGESRRETRKRREQEEESRKRRAGRGESRRRETRKRRESRKRSRKRREEESRKWRAGRGESRRRETRRGRVRNPLAQGISAQTAWPIVSLCRVCSRLGVGEVLKDFFLFGSAVK